MGLYLSRPYRGPPENEGTVDRFGAGSSWLRPSTRTRSASCSGWRTFCTPPPVRHPARSACRRTHPVL